MLYHLSIIHKDDEALADAIKARIESELSRFGYDRNLLRVEEGYGPNGSAEFIGCGLYIGSARAQADPQCLKQVGALLVASIPVVPLLKKGDSFKTVVPEPLHPINAIDWISAESSRDVASVLLRLLGLTEKQRRVFISYRRSDALEMGEQIWEVLSKRGFRVFIDRFSIEPGADFQHALTEQLADKAFVLVIESPDIRSSSWIEYETTYAQKERMGFLSLIWPQTVAADQGVPCIDDSQRYFLLDTDLHISGRQGELTTAFLDRLPLLVETAHAQAMLRRRRQLMTGLQDELSRIGVAYKLISDWSLLAELDDASGGEGHVFSITPRPPELPDLFLLHNNCEGHEPPIGKGVLIHGTHVPEDQQQILKWAIKDRQLVLVHEDQIVQFIGSIGRTHHV